MQPFGSSLTDSDLARFRASYITPDIAERAGLVRVDSHGGAEIVCRTARDGRDYSGIIFPYRWPGESNVREYRLRRDNPEIESKNGRRREIDKYLTPAGRGNKLYFPPDTPAEWLADTNIPVTIVEGEKKALALDRYYRDRNERRLVIAIPGVWCWRGTVGKTTNNNGARVDEKGPIPDLTLIKWTGRVVLILFDANVRTNLSVRRARDEFSRELRRRGASVVVVDLPETDNVNGIDDLLALKGPDYVAQVLASETSTSTADWEEPSLFVEEPATPFPLDALPPVIEKHVREVSIEIQTPYDLAAMLDLTVGGAAVARVVRVHVWDDWSEPLNIHSVTALASGTRKSPVFRKCVHPLELEEAERRTAAKPLIAEATARVQLLERRLDNATKQAAKTKSTVTETEVKQLAVELLEARDAVPAMPQLIVDDITPESLKTALAQQNGRIAALSPEGDIFEIFAGRYSSGTPNIDVLLKGHTGDTIRVNRSSRYELIDHPALSLGLTTQPDVIRGLAEKPGFRGRGVLARLLITLPDDFVGYRETRPAPMAAETQRRYEATIRNLSRLEPNKDEFGKDVPHWIRLSREAVIEMETFHAAVEKQMRPNSDVVCIRDWVAKFAGASARIAGILHLLKHAGNLTPWPGEVDAETMGNAIRIGNYLLSHAKRAFALMGTDPRTVDAKYVAQWIKNRVHQTRDWTFTRRDAHRGMHSRFPTVDDLDAPLCELENRGMVREDVPTVRGRGRPSPTYEVSTLWIPSDADTDVASWEASDAANA